jgi:hypothetical protein
MPRTIRTAASQRTVRRHPRRARASLAAVGIALAGFAGAVSSAAASDAAQLSGGVCDVTSTMPAPAPGTAVTQGVTVNPETCAVTFGTVQTVPSSSIPPEAASTMSDPTLGGPLVSGGSLAAGLDSQSGASLATTCHTWSTSSRVYDNDVANIEINGLNTSTTYCGNGSTLTNLSGSYTYHVHKEEVLGICNPLGCGWVAHNAAYNTTSGCSEGCASEQAHAHVDFSYSGDFDPFGALVGYHNYLDAYNTFNGNATASCSQTFKARVNPGHVGPVDFFYWKHSWAQ